MCAASLTPLLRYRHVDVTRRELVVLKDVNLELMPGEFVYLTGSVGAGKSSLLKTIYAEIPLAGATEARVLDYDLLQLRRRDIPYLRRRVGIVFQDFRLLDDRSVRANLEFVLRATDAKDRDAIDQRIEDVLKEVGLPNKSYKMPHELSGGEQQRVAIARAMLNRPPILLADEPTGNLDVEASVKIVSLLHDLRSQGTTVVMATHNTALLQRFPARTLHCADKKLLER